MSGQRGPRRELWPSVQPHREHAVSCINCGCDVYYDDRSDQWRHVWTSGTECAFNVPNPSIATPFQESTP
jgi:hypothetical protein